MVEFKVVKSQEIKFGNNNFIEIARKKAVSDFGEREFISISRGFYLQNGDKAYRSSLTIPSEKEKKEKISKAIKEI